MCKGTGEGTWAKVGTLSSGVPWGHTAGQPDPQEAREERLGGLKKSGGWGFPEVPVPKGPCAVWTQAGPGSRKASVLGEFSASRQGEQAGFPFAGENTEARRGHPKPQEELNQPVLW